MKFTNRHIAIIALIIANIVWGAASPMFKWALQDVPPFTLAFFRFFIAALVLWPFVVPHMAIKMRDIPKIALLSFVGLVINITFFFLGLQLTSSIDAPIIGASAPIMLIIFAIFYLHEKPKKKVIIGTLISLIGILIIVVRPFLEHGGNSSSITGNLCLLISTGGFVVYTVLLKKFDLPYNALSLIFWLFFMGTIMFLPFFGWEAQNTDFMHHINLHAVVGILFGALSSSTLAYLCYDLGVKYLKATEVGIFFYLDPIATIFLAMPLLGEKITILYIIGALTVFAGIIVAEAHPHHNPRNLLSKHRD